MLACISYTAEALLSRASHDDTRKIVTDACMHEVTTREIAAREHCTFIKIYTGKPEVVEGSPSSEGLQSCTLSKLSVVDPHRHTTHGCVNTLKLSHAADKRALYFHVFNVRKSAYLSTTCSRDTGACLILLRETRAYNGIYETGNRNE